MLKIGVLGSGTGSNMQAIADAIGRGELEARIVCVASDVAGAKILERGVKLGVPSAFIDPAPFKTKLDGIAEARVVEFLQANGVEVVVLAGFMRVIKGGLLRAFPNRVVNIHPALLPSFPGLEGWRQALEYGVKVAGCTVHFVDEGIDSGPIIVQRTVPVLDGESAEELHRRIQIEEHQAYPEALRLLASGKLRIEGRRVLVERESDEL